MMRMDSGGGPFPNDGLHQLFRHYPVPEAGLWGCRKVRKNLDGTKKRIAPR